jgi:hypothetical protein
MVLELPYTKFQLNMSAKIETKDYSSITQNKEIRGIRFPYTNLGIVCTGLENGGVVKVIHKQNDGSYFKETINVQHGETIETTVPYKKNKEYKEMKIRISAP